MWNHQLLVISNRLVLKVLKQESKNFTKKTWSRPKILGFGRVRRSKFNIQALQILGATVQNLVAMETWRRGFVHPCIETIINTVSQ